MPQDNQQLTTSQKAAPKPPAQVLEGILTTRQDQIMSLLGNNGTFDQFKQVVMLSVMKQPTLLDCKPESMIKSCLECASDGLIPDGRQAALVIYGSEVQYQPMVAGIILCLMRTGLVKDIQVDCVYEGEFYQNISGSHSDLIHHPGFDRDGDDKILGAYAVIRTVSGGMFKRAMGRAAIMKVRNIAKTKKVWDAWFTEMAQKTVLRNLSKLLPKDLDLPVFRRDDALYDLSQANAPVVRTVQLGAPPGQKLDHTPIPQETNVVETKLEPRPKPDVKPEPKPEPEKDVLNGDDIPAHIREGDAGASPPAPSSDPAADVPPAEGQKSLSAPVQPAAADDDGFPGDRKADSGGGMPVLIQKSIDALKDIKDWPGLESLMAQVWARPNWPDILKAGQHKEFYGLIKTMPVWKEADTTTETYSKILRS